ncbi:hypothetical protein FRB91_004105 [Serendipita sp. 411]|nr:hypothetical protein FRC18_000138 [Serendipita sp. 400]KAG8842559.1 hypothetical protein FRB91_004105 [Serendipita sp. 411]KAG9052467.1 hypothetical protein FS842_009828 [Serendipita sp. 407]
MEKHEKRIMGLIIASMLCAVLEVGFSFGDGHLGAYSIWIAPAAAILTIILQSVTLGVWRKTDKKRKGTTKPSFIYSVTLCVLSCLLAVLWLASCILTFLVVGIHSTDSFNPLSPVAWVEALFTLVNMSLMWAIFGMVVHYRKKFFKRVREAKRQQGQLGGVGFLPSQPQQPMPIQIHLQQQPLQQYQDLPFLTKTSLETHTKWILALIIIGMVFCLAELGISFRDGAFGGYSLWLAPTGAFLTEILHIVTLSVWKHTAKKRKGTPKPSFIYSVTLCVLTCLLAVYWKATAIMTFILASVADYDYNYGSGSYDPYGEVQLPWVEATFALILSCLMWAEFGLVVHFRLRFLKEVKHARNAGQLPSDAVYIVAPPYSIQPYAPNQYNPVAFQQQPVPYQYGQYQPPAVPPPNLMKDTPPVPTMPNTTSQGYLAQYQYPPQPVGMPQSNPFEKSG